MLEMTHRRFVQKNIFVILSTVEKYLKYYSLFADILEAVFH